MVDVCDAGAVDEVHRTGGGVDACDGRVLYDAWVLEGEVAKVGVVGVAQRDGVHEAVFGGAVRGEVEGYVCGGDGGADNNDALKKAPLVS